jgi:hypothetical protein
MRHLLHLAIAPTALLLPGCPIAPGCGVAYNGGSDQVYQRGTDTLIVCANGGYAANLAGSTQEGLYDPTSRVATIGATGAYTFTLEENADGSVAGFGNGLWSPVALDQVALSHADVQCTDLVNRPWWAPAAALHLPIATAFSRPLAGYSTIEACVAAQTAGQLPESVACEQELLVCPDGTAFLLSNETNNEPLEMPYEATEGTLDINGVNNGGLASIAGELTNGTLVTSNGTWQVGPVSASGMSCP